MSSVNAKDVVEAARAKGWRAALFGFVTAIVFAVLDHFTAQIGPALINWITLLVDPPRIVLKLSEPLSLGEKALSLQELKASPADLPVTVYQQQSPRLIVVDAGPGSYFLTLRRIRDQREEIWVDKVDVSKDEESLSIDVSNKNWSPVEGGGASVTNTEGGLSEATGTLAGTRWVTSSEDYEALQAARNPKLRLALSIALSEVGTHEFGSAEERERIANYWRAVPQWRGATENVPWGGTFMSWIMTRAELPSPQSASFRDWLTWGEIARQPEPGDVVVFSTPGLPESASRLLVGVYLKKQDNCTEIVAGNISDRVVVTCVRAPPRQFRTASPSATSASKPSAD